MEQGKILVIGSYNVGLICRTPLIPNWGETIMGSNFSESYGGKGSNQAVGAARLNGEVTFLGCLGNDKYGDDGMNMLQTTGINTSYIKRSNQATTGVGIILLNEENDNCIIVDPGANNELTPEYIKHMEHLIQKSDVIVLQLEIPLETVEQAMKIAHKLGKKVILNPAPADAKAERLLPLTTVVNPNESELLLLNGQSTDTPLSEKKCERLAKNLLTKGAEAVIVTRGNQDCIVVTSDSVDKVPVFPVKAMDTTGAGDAFTGALAVQLAKNTPLLEAVKFANTVGSYCVTKKEVIPGLPTQEKLDKFLQSSNHN